MNTALLERVAAQFDRLLTSNGRWGVAYSGGGDSLALLQLLTQWTPDFAERFTVLIVDHGLRPESPDEAALAARHARDLGYEPQILRWGGDKPDTAVQERARDARHQLLAKAAHAHGLCGLLLAHTQDDQAETIWMRMQAGGGWRGCIGMRERAWSPSWPEGRDVQLVRPLLSLSRAELRDYLAVRGASWIEDPSNEDARYTRIRVRRDIAELKQGGFDMLRLTALGATLSAADQCLRRVAAQRASMLEFAPWGGVRVRDQRVFEDEAGRYLLEAAIAAVSGQRTPPKQRGLEHLRDACQRGVALSACGVRLLWSSTGLWIIRDSGAVLGRVDHPGARTQQVKPGWPMVWDGRALVESRLPDCEIGPLGRDYCGLPDAKILAAIPGEARATLGCLRKTSGEIAALEGVYARDGAQIASLALQRFRTWLIAEPGATWSDGDLPEGPCVTS